MKSTKNIVSKESVLKCLKHSDNPKVLIKLCSELVVTVRSKGIKKYFAEDTAERRVLAVRIKKAGKSINFTFGTSLKDTVELTESEALTSQDLLYDLLSCCGSDAYYPIDFNDFCSEYGYDTDSIKALKTFKRCQVQSEKLNSIFSESEIESLPR